MVASKAILLSVVVNMTSAFKVTAPVYVCVPVVVTLALIADVEDTLILAAVLMVPSIAAVVVATELAKLTVLSISNTLIRYELPTAPEKVFRVPVICKVPSFALAPSIVPAMVTELFCAKIILASPVLSSKVIPVELVTALLKVTVLSSASTLPPVIVIVGTVTASWNNAAPALLDVPTVKVSAATVPVNVTVAGAPSALSMTLISVVPSPSLIVPVTDLFVEVLNNKVPALVIFAVTASLKVAVLFAAFTILVAVTAAVKEALLLRVKTSNEVVPTIPVTDADPDPSVKVKSRAVLSLSIVAPKVMLLSVVVNVVSALNTTAPE